SPPRCSTTSATRATATSCSRTTSNGGDTRRKQKAKGRKPVLPFAFCLLPFAFCLPRACCTITPFSALPADFTSGFAVMTGPFGKLWQRLRQRPPRAACWFGALLLLATGIGLSSAYSWSRAHLADARQALQRHDLNEAQHHLELSLRGWSWNAEVKLLA